MSIIHLTCEKSTGAESRIFFMLALSCPEGKTNLGLATVTASFSSENTLRLVYVHCPLRLTAAFLSPSAKSGTRQGPIVWWTVMLSFQGKGHFGTVIGTSYKAGERGKDWILQGWREKWKGGTRLKDSAKLSERKLCFVSHTSAIRAHLLPRKGTTHKTSPGGSHRDHQHPEPYTLSRSRRGEEQRSCRHLSALPSIKRAE